MPALPGQEQVAANFITHDVRPMAMRLRADAARLRDIRRRWEAQLAITPNGAFGIPSNPANVSQVEDFNPEVPNLRADEIRGLVALYDSIADTLELPANVALINRACVTPLNL